MSMNFAERWEARKVARRVRRIEVRERILGGLRVSAPAPSLQDQFESLLDCVWQQEAWERRHPFTAATLREVRL